MRLRNKFLYVFFLVAVQLVLLSYGEDAWAVSGQTYTGDGAKNNTTVPPGGWLNYGYNLDSTCFACHNGHAAPPFDTAPNMTSYLMTGHKNAMRMVRTPPLQLTGTNGLPYGTDETGNPFLWATNSINILGFCTDPAFLTEAACSSGGGVWISGIKNLYYINGGWMNDAPGALFNGNYTQGTQKTALSFGTCARCHTTGFTMDTGLLPFRAPDGFFPGISWTPTDTTGKIDFDPDGNGPADRGSWQVVFSTGQPMGLEGVQCERCHDASTHFQLGGSVTRPRGTEATALCVQCHRQDHVITYTSGVLGTNIVPTAFTDNAPSLPANEPLFGLPAIEVGGPNGYEPEFYDYSIGMEFLNGAHAKFTGNFQQIADPTRYGSSFTETIYSCSNPLYVSQTTCTSNGGTWSQSEVQGGCTTCHDVHQSAVKAVNAAAPFKKQCTDCHTGGGTAPQVSVLNHPPGPGTPLEDVGAEPSSPCQICHMPRLNQGSSSPIHLFRINTDASYSTFPTESEWNSGQKTANTSPDGTYTGAVWSDVDISCGQCHGEGGSAFHFTKTQLAAVAAIMHSTDVSGIDCTLCHTTLIQSGPGQNHHSGTCIDCHGTGAPDGRALHDGTPPSTANSACLTCHTTINQGVNHHVGTCVTCHSEPGVHQYVTTNASCLSCHTTINQGVNHHVGTCITCHMEPGVHQLGTTNASCLSCHTTINQGVNHHVGTCVTCHTEPGVAQYTTTNASCLTCHTAINQGVNHHVGTCVTCHTEPGVAQYTTANASCATCHTENIAAMNHPTGGQTPANCVTCHTEPGAPINVNNACGQCHNPAIPGAPAFTSGEMAAYAVDIHNTRPTANFNWTNDSSVSRKVNFDASASHCPTGYTCTHGWDFGGLATGTGITTSYTFPDTTARNVTLTVTTNANATASLTKSVTPIILNAAPVVGKAGLTFNNLQVSFTDASSDDNVGGPATVYVSWGDGGGVAVCGAMGSVCTRTYAAAGTYNISHYVIDVGGLYSAYDNFQVTVPAKFNVTVNTTGTPVVSALVQIKQGGTIKSQGFTNVSGSWTSLIQLPAGNYTVSISKAGVTFDCDAGVGGNQNTNYAHPLLNPLNANATISCSHTP